MVAFYDLYSNALKAPTKRKAFFSFHYDDIMRVNNVRNAWKINHPNSDDMRGFYDGSLWESRKAEGDEAIKTLIREGVQYTSAVCVLVGTETWTRRWVKYEIARSVIDERGLLAVHINNLNHHQRQRRDACGRNPLHYLGVCKSTNGQLHLCENVYVNTNGLPVLGHSQWHWQWQWYADYTLPVPLPRYLRPPNVNEVIPLSAGAGEYDYVTGYGHQNIGAWIDQAAQAVGR
jgi:MTH538 TIR-like domain (DUF1863)